MSAEPTAAPSKVYYTNLRTYGRESQLDKLRRLIKRAGIEQIDFENKFVAIKIHFGELGNLSFLRPNYARAVADVVKELGGMPFLTDCNTLYVGSRKNALEHIDCAYQNGFTPYATGCQVIIADGLKGTDETLVPVKNGEYVQEAKIGHALMDADIVISLTHFKGHEQAGFGGCMKNLGMGGGSRAGKMEQHAAGKPSVDESKCIGCHACERICAHGAVSFPSTRERTLKNGRVVESPVARIDHDRCLGCGRCIGACNQDAIEPDYDAAADVLNYKNRRVRAGDRAGPPELPHLARHRREPQLRLPRGERHAHRARYRHVRELRPGRHRPGVHRCGAGHAGDAEHRAHRDARQARGGRRRAGAL